MTVAAAPPGPAVPTGLEHLGLVYDDVPGMVRAALPEIRRVLDADGDVHLTVDRRGVREFREALGPDADRVRFPTPHESFGGSTDTVLRSVRRRARTDRRLLVLGQYAVSDLPEWDCAVAEDAVNLVMGDLPLTVLCACDRGTDTDRDLVTRSHPVLVGVDGRVANPAYRSPDAVVPVPGEVWGAPVTTMTVRGGADLAELRRRVTTVTEHAGLAGPAARSTVLAVHEAVLLAAGADLDGDSTIPPGDHVVDVRATEQAVVAECRGGGTVDRLVADDPRLEHLPLFCDGTGAYDTPTGRVVRVLATVR